MGMWNWFGLRERRSGKLYGPGTHPIFEHLEARILLSGDSLIGITAPDPLQGMLLDSTRQAVQYAELLERNEHVEVQLPSVEQEICQQIGPCDTLETDLCEPAFTLFVDNGNDTDNGEPIHIDLNYAGDFKENSGDPSIDNVGHVRAGENPAGLANDSVGDTENKGTLTKVVETTADGEATNSVAVLTEDGNMPTYVNHAEIGLEENTFIEIRGPPAEQTSSIQQSNAVTNDCQEIAYASDTQQLEGDAEGLYAPLLPGLELVDSDPSDLQGQIIYLDFNGEPDVTYNGPVMVGPFDVRAFRAPGDLSGQEQLIIFDILETLEDIFAGSSIVFTTERPSTNQPYSTIYIGGDDSTFADYGSFLGLAEQVDVGNTDPGDKAFVFSDSSMGAADNRQVFVDNVADIIAHEAGHLLGYRHGAADGTGQHAELGWECSVLRDVAAPFGDQSVISTQADSAQSVYACDLDGDGDDDVLSASENDDKIAWYENRLSEPTADFASQQVISTGADGAYSVYARDLDGDGDNDVLSASANDDKIAWYENLGGGNFGDPDTNQRVISTQADGARSVYACDLDGDGDNDVLSASADDNKIAWYENRLSEPTADFASQQVISVQAGAAQSVYACDLDGDGDNDVLSASENDDKIAWYENRLSEPTADFASQQVISVEAGAAKSVYASDLDGDGDNDVLSANWADPYYGWAGIRLLLELLPRPEIEFDCWDDGHQDPVLVTTTSVADLDETDGHWTEFHWSNRPFPSVMAGVGEENYGLPMMRFYADGIENGEYEVIANLYTANSGRDMRYYYGYTPDNPKAYSVDTTGGTGGSDQHEEYNLGTVNITDSTFNIYVQDADLLGGTYPFFGWAWIRLVPVAEPPPPEPEIEFDCWGDGHQDPVLVTTTSVADLDETDGQWTEFQWSNRPFPSVMAGVEEENFGLPMMRFYADGIENGEYEVIANLYTSTYGRDMRYYYGYSPDDPKLYSVVTTGGTGGSDQHEEYSLGTVNISDGTFNIYVQDADLVGGSYDKIAWYENLGGGTFGSQQVISTGADGAYSVYASDLDGDGDNDVLSASGNDDKIAWYENLGGGTFGSQQLISTQASGAKSVYACDLDGDGDNDVLSASEVDDTVAWYKNFSGGTQALQSADALVLVNSTSAGYGDFQYFIQPYLDNFGIPYTLVDIATTFINEDVGEYAVIIVGHRQLDPDNLYLDGTEEANISAAVSAGTGLVNFDNDLSADGTTGRYQFVQDIFNFGYVAPSIQSGVTFGTQINCWEDNHQDPVLVTTTSVVDLDETDGQWTEFHWSSRPFPSVMAGVEEENYGLPMMHFYADGIENGQYEVIANLYTSASGRDMRYYYGYTPDNAKAHSVDTTGGTGGSDQHEEYSLGTVNITDGTFSIYVQDADLLGGAYPFFGWAWIRLVAVGGASLDPETHYITACHEAGELIDTGDMILAGITLPADVNLLASTGDQPFLSVTTIDYGRAVQWGTYDWMSHSVKGPLYGLDDLVWRSIVWAARKPFVMQGLPNFVTMRVDDASGDFWYVETASEFGLKPWIGVFYQDLQTSSGLPLMRFYADDIENGEYEVIANLYTANSGRDMRYYYGYTPDNAKAYSVDTTGGTGGSDQHEEYSLGIVNITDSTFNIYVQDADLLGGTYAFFGWAWIRLIPIMGEIEIQINCWEDAHQDPVLVTTTSVADLDETDGQWTEFYWSSRPFPSVMAGAEEENAGSADDVAAQLSALVNGGNATVSVHAKTYQVSFYYNHNGYDFSDEQVAANFASATAWHIANDIPISKFVVPHYYEFGTNVFQGLLDWGVEFVGTHMNPGTNYYGSDWLVGGPYRLYESGSSMAVQPVYYADFITVPGHPEFDGLFFNSITEIRDDTGYEWYPDNDVSASIDRGTQQIKRAFDSMVPATLFTHEQYIQTISPDNWRAILEGITTNIAPYDPIYVSMDYGCQYVRAMYTSDIISSIYDPMSNVVTTILGGDTDMPTMFYLFTEEDGIIRNELVDAPTFSGSAEIIHQVVHAESLALHAADVLADEQIDSQLVMPDLLEPVVEEAILRWADYGIGSRHISTLQDVEFRIADLAGSTIGLALGNTIWLDIDAAGYRWFIDSTPWDNAEFSRRNTGSELVAKRASEAYGDIDLQTVVMHEMGHMLGFEDLTSETESKDLMYEILQSGVRRTKILPVAQRSTTHITVAWHYLSSLQKNKLLLTDILPFKHLTNIIFSVRHQ